MKVLVLNHYAHNKGDRAVLYFLTRELARCGIDRVAVSTSDPHRRAELPPFFARTAQLVPWGWTVTPPLEETLLRRGTYYLKSRFRPYTYPIVRGLMVNSLGGSIGRMFCNPDFRQALEASDLVLSTGGHHVTTLLARDAISGQIYDMALALMAGKPLVLWSQSIGPLCFVNPRNEVFVRRILSETSEIFVRDEHSLVELERLGIQGPTIRQTCESVIGLSDVTGGYLRPSCRAARVGIAVYSTKNRSEKEHARYVQAMSDLVDHVADRGCKSRFFAMETRGASSDDRPLIREIMSRVRCRESCDVEDRDLDTMTHLSEVARCRLFVGHKTHSVIFALAVGTPVIALAYHQKTEDFMNRYGLKRFCIPDANLSAESLATAFDEAQSDVNDLGDQILEESRRLGGQVRADFHDMVRRWEGATLPVRAAV
ncbi:MAG: polysaccharide pyruvyl transferase family protein [Phycisphaerae bacterium]|nr:polysaccharide pyruvyl transferase family protein [Phycisphaerae bacterium]